MKVIIEQATSWIRALNAARWTVGKVEPLTKEPTDKFKISILMPQHSPIRMVEYDIKIIGIPYCNATHFIRHHLGIEKFQCTLRDNRNEEIDDRRKLPQDYPVNLWISANADAIISVSRRRLCLSKPDAVTQNIWLMVRAEMQKTDPVMARFMVKDCVYRGFCAETPCCKYCITNAYSKEIDDYRKGFVYGKINTPPEQS